MSVTAAIIALIGSITTASISAGLQHRALREGKKEAREMYEEETQAEKENAAWVRKYNEGNAAEKKREFDITANLQSQQNQYDRINNILDKNEQLKSLFINRIAGLRR